MNLPSHVQQLIARGIFAQAVKTLMLMDIPAPIACEACQWALDGDAFPFPMEAPADQFNKAIVAFGLLAES